MSVGAVLSTQRLLDRAAELLCRERLDQRSGEHDTELEKLGWGRGDARTDQRQPWIDDARGLREHHAGRSRRLEDQHVRALQLFGSRNPYEDRFMTEAHDHPLEQSPNVIVGLTDQYSCHVSMIDRARWIPGGQTV